MEHCGDGARRNAMSTNSTRLARLASLGFSVDLAGLRQAHPRAALGRKHVADWLVRTGQAAGHREVFATLLGDGGPAYVPKRRLDCAVAIELIRGAGGVAGLAHPPYDLTLRVLGELVDAGLAAIEVGGPGIGTRHARRWRDWAGQLGLACVAGSDFHAPDRPGRWVGAITITNLELDRLRARSTTLEPVASGG